jgi:SAM-dependent methyltransferase
VGDAAYDATLFARLAQAEPRSFWFRARNRLVVSVLDRDFPALTSVLEVGCGTGFVLAGVRAAYPRARLVGVDLFEEGLRVARERVPDAEFGRIDVGELPYEQEFDLVCAFDVLEHLDDDSGALVQMHHAVKTGGGIVLLVPQHKWLWSGADTSAHHRRRYTRRELVARVEAAGFEILSISSFTTLLLPAMLLSRASQRFLHAPHDLWRELDPGFLNRPFEALLNLERWLLIERGVSFPVGGSLLLVGRRSE